MIESNTELTLVPKAPTPAPARGPASVRAAAAARPAGAMAAASPASSPASPAGSTAGSPAATPARDTPVTRRHAWRLEFTGTGADYFRVWIVNTLLTLATLGVYSAWAKRRKARWFARHTLLAGEPFDFHGDPRRILVGRVLALALLLVCVHAFDWSLAAGVAALAALYVLGPMLFAGAQRFKLGNLSWRGLRFGFQPVAVPAYASCLPLLVAWTLVAFLVSLGPALGPWVSGFIGLTAALLIPIAHGRLRQFQHRHARYGALAFNFHLPVEAFYGLYLRVGGALIAAGVVTALMGAGVSLGWKLAAGAPPEGLRTALPLVAVVVAWACAWPIYIARLQQVVWSNTRLAGGIEFASDVSGVALLKTVLGQGLLTVLTLGLYWPFLAVRVAKLRIEGMSVMTDAPVGGIVVQAPPRRGPGPARGPVADGTGDTFGLDVGW
ncbi:YjgN family protein [Roseateles chitinivorans]|uniref:YjgN family protein n=1 Tax=Roseateles chitinivorans TaxID=2917965 RepID=UPI003D669521